MFAADWPQFRGPTQQGVSTESDLPVTWSETENIAWKTEVPGLGWSSPSIADAQIWLTTATDDGRSLRAIRLDLDTGRIVRDVEVFQKDDPGSIHKKNSHASPTPVIEEDRVYVHFGKHGTACLTTDGDVLWRTELNYDHRHGPGGSPVIFENLLILNCDGTDTQYVTALDKRTGREVWKQPRGEGATMAYSTPTLAVVEGRPLLVSTGGEWTIAYEPATGDEVWRFRYPKGYSNVPRPAVDFGMTFISSGYNTPTLYAIRLDGRDDITRTNVVWKVTKGAPRNTSPLVAGDELYMVSDNGIVTCLNAQTGQQHWQERIGGDCSASPLFADGRVYITNEVGVTTVLASGRKFEELAKNELPGRTLASLATADGAIFLRTDAALYRIQKAR